MRLCLFHLPYLLPAKFFWISSCSALSWGFLTMAPFRQLLSSTLDKFTLVPRYSSCKCILLLNFSLKLRKTRLLVTGLCHETRSTSALTNSRQHHSSPAVLTEPITAAQEGFTQIKDLNKRRV